MELPPEGYFMQVGSHRSLEAASDAYSDLQDRFASALGGLDPDIKEEDLGAKGVYYRVRVGPWQTREEAAQICETLKVAGGSCLVTR
jgi:cell division protein FtsN